MPTACVRALVSAHIHVAHARMCDVALCMVQAVESEKKNGTGQGKLFGIFHISAFDIADTPGQVKQAAQDAKNAVGNASCEPTAHYLQIMGHP